MYCMYVCMYVCIHVRKYMQTSKYGYMYVSMYTSKCVCIHVCMYVYVHIDHPTPARLHVIMVPGRWCKLPVLSDIQLGLSFVNKKRTRGPSTLCENPWYTCGNSSKRTRPVIA